MPSKTENLKLSRQAFVRAIAAAAVISSLPRVAAAQGYPSRPIRLVVGFPPGGGGDMVFRLMAQWLSERLGQQVIVENKPGAGGNVATEIVAHSPPDGYTLTYVGPVAAINPALYKDPGFNFIRDIAPVASIVRVPLVLEVTPSLPVASVPEFIAYSRANPGKVNMASSGTGTAGHVAGELFQMMTGVKLFHVPYHGETPALTDLIAGRVEATFNPLPASIGYLKAGKLRPLAMTTTKRSQIFPDVPCVSDFVPGYEASVWYGVGAPKNTPPAVVGRLNEEINAALADPRIRSRLSALGGLVLPGSPADFGKLIAEETVKWAKVVKFAGIGMR
jgi:tripartite-type tricarboxylate transporter receptor subunit TctC